jgi:hypothetical protein
MSRPLSESLLLESIVPTSKELQFMNAVGTDTPLGFVGVGAMGSRIIPGLLAAIGVCQHCSDAILWRKLRRKPKWVRCLAILGLCLFVTAGLQAQTPDPTPLDAPQPGV